MELSCFIDEVFDSEYVQVQVMVQQVQNWKHVYASKGEIVWHMFIMDDPNITMEEYIKLEEEKARRHGRTFNWQTATYGKMECCEDEDDNFMNLITEYPVIVFDDTFDAALSCKPTVSPLNNNEIDFKISFDESDDEDYMVIFDENSFSCKIISVNNLKTDSENENDKVNIPSSPSLEPTIGYIDDLDFFKDYENEFPTIAYNDLMSKSNPLIEASDNDDNIDMTQPSRSNVIDIDTNGWMPLNLIKNLYVPFGISFDPKRFYKDGAHTRILRRPRDQRHPWLRYQVEGYGEDIVHCYEQRLETIWGRSVNRVHVLDFAGLTEGMRQTLGDWLSMVYIEDEGQELFTSHAWRRMSDTEMGLDVADTLCFQLRGARRMMTWRQFILALGLHTKEEMVEAGFGAYWQGSERVIPDKRDLRDYWMEISSDKDFLGPTPSYVFIRDPVRRLCHRMIACSISGRGQAPEKVISVDLFYLRSMDRGTANVPYLLAQYLFRHAKGRKKRASLYRGHFIGRLVTHLDWLATAGAPKAANDAPAADEGAQADPTPMQAPQPPPPAPKTIHQRVSRLEEELMDASGRTYQAFDSTLVGSSQLPYQRRTRRKTGDANTSAP
ncbi:hypothetical protein Tco_0683482 [Tanacetum coccineum]|uniref:Uncharacterized protein n=1 Tax=Tanacetum coccineum TaxID=301880 RepID=A0ABQ4XV98_9ASTR